MGLSGAAHTLKARHMIDPLSSTASALTIVQKLSAAVQWLYRKLQRGGPKPQLSDVAGDFEVRAVGFKIDLTQTIPFIELRFYAINYLTRPLMLSDGKVTLSLPPELSLDLIPLTQGDFVLKAKSATMVTFRRNLIDSEARAVPRSLKLQSGSYSLVARAKDRNNEHKYGPVGSMWIEGWINYSSSTIASSERPG
jgi:hypothetical protein